MATPILSTGISRRTMLAGSIATPATLLPLLSALATLPAPAFLAPKFDTDAELFRCIALAEELRNRHARARRVRDRLREARERRPEFPPSYFRERYPVAWRDYFETFERYATAVRAAVAVPACTVAGVHAKLALATIAARRGGARVYMYEDREWLEAALADLERLADRERHLGRAGGPPPQGRVPA